MKLLQPILTIVAALALVFVISTITYDMCKKEMIVVVNLKPDADPFVVLPQILPGEITQIREVDHTKKCYKMKIKSHKERRSLMEWLLGMDTVESARFDDD